MGEVLLENDTARMARLTIAPGKSAALTDAPPLVVIAINKGVVATDGKSTNLNRAEVIWAEALSLTPQSTDNAPFDAFLVMLKPRAIHQEN